MIEVICKNCSWEYIEGDLYCSGCGTINYNLNVLPSPGKIYIYEDTQEIVFKIINEGLYVNSLLSSDLECSIPEKLLAFPNLFINPDETQELKIPVKSLVAKQSFNFKINNTILLYQVEVCKSPELKIQINQLDKNEDGNYYISDKENTITLNLISNVPIFINQLKINNQNLETYCSDFQYEINLELDPSSVGEHFKLHIELLETNLKYDFDIKLKKTVKNSNSIKDITPIFTGDNNFLVFGENNKELLIYIEKTLSSILFHPVVDNNYNNFVIFKEQKDNNGDAILLFDINPSCISLKDFEGSFKVPIIINCEDNLLNLNELVEIKIDFEIRKRLLLDQPLVIDFGTSSTAVSWIEEDINLRQKIKHLKFQNKEDSNQYGYSNTQPSIIHFEDVTNSVFRSDNFTYNGIFQYVIFNHSVWGWKKFFGKNKLIITAIDRKSKTSHNYNIIDLTRIYLEKILANFRKFHKWEINQIAFTFPASYESKKKDLFIAFEQLGYPKERVKAEINEPNSLAYYYATLENNNFLLESAVRPIIYAIFDFGGGTTDITITKVEKNGNITEIETLDSFSPPNSGGDYLDFEISLVFKSLIEKKLEKSIYFPNDLEELLSRNFDNTLSQVEKNNIVENAGTFMDAARKLKHSYPNHDKRFHFLKLYEGGVSKQLTLDTVITVDNSFDEIINLFITRLLETLKVGIKNLQDLKRVSSDKIDYIILCGNGSKISLVNKIAKETFEKTEVINAAEGSKLKLTEGACKFYASNPLINFKKTFVLPVTLGYSRGGMFKPFINAINTLTSTRGLKINLEDPSLFQLEQQHIGIQAQKKETIYASYLTSSEIKDKSIFNNENIFKAGEIIFPENFHNKNVFTKLAIEIKNQEFLFQYRLEIIDNPGNEHNSILKLEL